MLTMNASNQVLLASHGTEGARAAERMAFRLCGSGSRLHHLVVVPELWKGMTGDDWLNNGWTRDRFRGYLESELEGEIREHVERLSGEADRHSIPYSAEVAVGNLEESLIRVSGESEYDLVVIGSPRPRGKPGIRSRMKTEPLAKGLRTPLLIVPYPNE